MRIAVHTNLSQGKHPVHMDIFLYETFRRITEKHPEHTFIFIFNRSPDERYVFASNVKVLVAGPGIKFRFFRRFWYNVKVPAILKSQRADVFVTGDGICSLSTPVPQCLIIPDLAFLHNADQLNHPVRAFYKKFSAQFFKKATRLATFSAFVKNDIVQLYSIDADKIDVVFYAVNDVFQPVTEIEKGRIKRRYTAEKEYFVYAGGEHPQQHLVNLLKAFSVFKKRQQTGMKLVLTGGSSPNSSFLNSLATYKYRNDVVITGVVDENELARIIGSAYGFVYPATAAEFGMPVLQAMKCAVPVITSVPSAVQEICGDAALYAEATHYKDMAEKMMRLYKDEQLRKTMIEKGSAAANNYNWDKTANLFWECIEKSVIKKPNN